MPIESHACVVSTHAADPVCVFVDPQVLPRVSCIEEMMRGVDMIQKEKVIQQHSVMSRVT